MKEHYTIGETARLNNVTIQALRYYDKLGIFKPDYTDPENVYRFYHIRQFFYLDIIKYLKHIKTPLEEIKCIITCNPEHMQTFLEEQEGVIEKEIENLLKARRLLYRRKNQLKEQLEICSKNDGSVYSRQIQEQTILKVDTPELVLFNQSDIYYRKLVDVLEERGDIIDNYYGFIYDLKPYSNPNNIYTSSIYTTICKGEKVNLKGRDIRSEIVPAGEYVCISFNWSTENYFSYYQKLLDYIQIYDIQTNGKVYQVSLPVNYSSSKEEQFLTELRVLKV